MKLENDKNIFIENINIFSNSNLIISFSFSKIKFLSLKGNFNKESFSLLNENCKDIFDSLEHLKIIGLENKSLFYNLSNNINNCKKLKVLIIPMNEKILKNFDKKTILELSNKFLSINLYKLFLSNFIYYTKKELNELFPNKISNNVEYFIPKLD